MAKYGIEVKWGFLFLLLTLVWMLAEKILGLHGPQIEKHAFYTKLFIFPVIALYIFALRERRHKVTGTMSWSRGFISGVILTLIITFLSPLGQIITHKIISPEYSSNVIRFAVESGRLSQADAESFFSLKSYIVQSMAGSFIMGVLLSSIVCLFVRGKVEAGAAIQSRNKA